MKRGDKIICVESRLYAPARIGEGLTFGMIYTVDHVEGNLVCIINDLGIKDLYFISRFISLKEFRKNKLLKLNSV